MSHTELLLVLHITVFLWLVFLFLNEIFLTNKLFSKKVRNERENLSLHLINVNFFIKKWNKYSEKKPDVFKKSSDPYFFPNIIIFFRIYIQWNCRTFLEYRTESNSIELFRSDRIKFFQYFYVFSSSVRSNRTHRANVSNKSCKIIA